MKTATLGQIRKVLELMETVSSEQVQEALENGLLAHALKWKASGRIISKDQNGVRRAIRVFWNGRGWDVITTDPAENLREQDGVIYFSVTSDGTTGEDWITRLESKGFRVGNYAKQVLYSKEFKPTKPGTITKVAALKGMLFEDQSRITKKIRAAADKRKLEKPNAEAACLIRERFTDEEIEAMGLWYIVAMHEPINNFDDDPNLLLVDRGDGGRGLCTYDGKTGVKWSRDGGFAFVVSQTQG